MGIRSRDPADEKAGGRAGRRALRREQRRAKRTQAVERRRAKRAQRKEQRRRKKTLARERRQAKREARIQRRAQRAQDRRTLWEDARNLPNLLTFLRIVMIPAVLVFLDRGTPKDCYWAALIYGAAAITDLLDGWLARRQGLVSVLGKFLDPLADKLIVTAVLVWMVPMGRISTWVVVLLLAREITITALRSVASSEGLVIAAGKGGKLKTALQMIGIICLIVGYPYALHLGVYDFGVIDFVHVGRLLVYLSLFFSLVSAAGYLQLFVEAIEAKKQSQAP